jgi:TonB family protein
MSSHRDRVDAGFTTSLIRRAAKAAPPELAERLEEEWLADLASRRNGFGRLRLALGCLWASQVIAHDFLAAGAAASAASAPRSVVALGPQGFSPFSRRTTIFMLIIGMHVALFYAFASGFAGNLIKRGPEIPTARMIDQDPPRTFIDHPMPSSSLNPQRLMVPDLPIADPLFERPITVPSAEERAGPMLPLTPPPPSSAVRRIQGGPGVGFPDTDDYYPSSAIRERDEGAAAVRVCVNEHGKLSADPTIVQSSGFQLLDDGALKLAKAGSGHYRTTTEDGRPVNDCYSFRIRFTLKQH